MSAPAGTQHRVARQQGAVLFVALIMLLLLSVIGVTGMRSATMAERMTGNMKERYRSFQVAEMALREGENDIESGAGAALPDDTNCDDVVVEALTDSDFTATAGNSENSNEVVAVRHVRYCGPRIRHYRDESGTKATSDAGSQPIIPVAYYAVVAVGRVPGNAETALVSTYAVISP